MEDTKTMTREEMEEEIKRLREETKNKSVSISLKVSEKGALSFYGLGRFPVTLYKNQWEILLRNAQNIEQFIRDNKEKLK